MRCSTNSGSQFLGADASDLANMLDFSNEACWRDVLVTPVSASRVGNACRRSDFVSPNQLLANEVRCWALAGII